MKNIKDEIKDIIEEVNDKKIVNEINDNTSLIDDLEFDSFLLMKLIVELEDHFKIEINDSEYILDSISSFENLVRYIENKLIRE